MTVTQFLGAFNDNLFKQLVLLLSIAAAAAPRPPRPPTSRGSPMLIFAAPFLAFTGFAGYLSDKFGKRGIVIICKLAEIVIMALGGLGFYIYWKTGIAGIPLRRAVPHGHAQRVLRPRQVRHPARDACATSDLPRANGFILMTTFLAIIFGTGLGRLLLEWLDGRLWLGSTACIVIAVARHVHVAARCAACRRPIPRLKFEWSALTVPPDMIADARARIGRC